MCIVGNPSPKTVTTVTVVEEEHFDADGNLTGRTKTTTTHTTTQSGDDHGLWNRPIATW